MAQLTGRHPIAVSVEAQSLVHFQHSSSDNLLQTPFQKQMGNVTETTWIYYTVYGHN